MLGEFASIVISIFIFISQANTFIRALNKEYILGLNKEMNHYKHMMAHFQKYIFNEQIV